MTDTHTRSPDGGTEESGLRHLRLPPVPGRPISYVNQWDRSPACNVDRRLFAMFMDPMDRRDSSAAGGTARDGPPGALKPEPSSACELTDVQVQAHQPCECVFGATEESTRLFYEHFVTAANLDGRLGAVLTSSNTESRPGGLLGGSFLREVCRSRAALIAIMRS